MNDKRIKELFDGIDPQPGAEERIRQKIEAELGRPMRETDVIVEPQIRAAFEGVRPQPGAEERIRQKLEAELGRPLSECSVTLQKRRNPLPRILAAAAMLVIVVGSAVLLFWPLIRQTYERIHEPAPMAGAMQPTPAPAAEPEPTPTPEPYELALYREILDLYREAISKTGTGTDAEERIELWKTISELVTPGQRLGYALTDLDGDGTRELLIGDMDDQTLPDQLFDIYTLDDGKPVRLAGSDFNSRWIDLGGGLLMEQWGANVYSFEEIRSETRIWSLENGRTELIFVDGLSYAAKEEEHWHALSMEDGKLIQGRALTEAEAEDWEHMYGSRRILHSFTPLDGDAESTPTPTPTPDPYELGEVENEGTVTAQNGNTLYWALDENDLLLIRGEGRMEDYFDNYHWQENWIDQLPWQGYNVYVRTLVLEPGLETVAEHAFENCRQMTALLLPDSLREIGYRAFYECSSLTSLTIPEGVTSIGDYAFFDNRALTEALIPESVTSIGEKAFSSCRLESVTIPGAVESMGEFVFSYCNRMTSAAIGQGVTTIAPFTFFYCSSLRSVTIPESVTEIGSCAFRECVSLSDVYYAGSEEQWQQIEIGGGNDWLFDATIHFGTGSDSHSADDPPADRLSAIVDEGTVTAENGNTLTWTVDENGLLLISGEGDMEDFFDHYHWQTQWTNQLPWQGYAVSIRTLVLDPGMETIAEHAFESCHKLTTLILPDGLKEIGDRAFSECDSLTSVTIPEGVTSIGEYAFSNDRSMTEAVIPESVTSIGEHAFSASHLESVTIPGSVESMGGFVFAFCNQMTSAAFEEGVTEIAIQTFNGCRSLQSVTIPKSVTKIGQDAFNYCEGLTDIYYAGSEEQWQQIEIGTGNDYWMRNATIHFNCEG